MATRDTTFGMLTLATPADYLKAIGLALSLRVSNPGIPVAVACAPKLRSLVEPYFDFVIDEMPGLRGFVHKVHIDEYSPFQETMFFDSDVLVFKPVKPYIDSWGAGSYHACGGYDSVGTSPFGLNRPEVLTKIGKDRLVVIDGAGHAFFRKPACTEVFDLARKITAEYRSYAGDIKYADEDVIDIALTILEIPPVPYEDFFARYLSARSGTMKMDASRGQCRFIARNTGEPFEPCMMHFAAKDGPVAYAWQLYRLFRKFGVPTQGLLKLTTADVFETKVRWRLGDAKRALKDRFRFS